MSRLDDLRRKLAASMGPNGQAAKGYKARVAMLKDEIARREYAEAMTRAYAEAGVTQPIPTPTNPVG